MKKKIDTIKLQGKDYAQVKDRVKEFRQDCPNGLIKTKPTIQEDGTILFKATIIKDKSDDASAESTGHAMGNREGAKAFEKLETIAVGRALALLGYSADGEIASADEMEEFIEYKKTQKEEMLMVGKEKLEYTKNLDELKKVWSDLPIEAKNGLEKVKEALKVKFEKVNVKKNTLLNPLKKDANTKVQKQGGVATSTKGKDNRDKA